MAHRRGIFSVAAALALLCAVGCSGEIDVTPGTPPAAEGEGAGSPAEPPGPGGAGSPATLGPEIFHDLEGTSAPPADHLIYAADFAPRPVPSLPELERALADDDRMRPLREALEAGGWDAAEQGQMVWAAAHHYSGQPMDPTAVRHREIQGELRGAVRTFADSLRQYEQDHDVFIDRAGLQDAGVILTLDAVEVPQ